MTDPESLESKIVRIEGPGGDFGIAFAGTGKEGLHYFYRDSRHSFFFYPQFQYKPLVRVTIEWTSGILVSSEEEARLRKNIEFFFKSRDRTHPEREPKPGMAAEAVAFQWRIAR
jgi:hypothetical protein